MKTPARLIAAAALAAITVLPAATAQAYPSQQERGVPSTSRPVDRARARQARERTLGGEHHTYPAPTDRPAANAQPAQDGLTAQRKALYQSELERTLARHRALGALDAIATQPASAAQPAARTDPAAPSPGVDVPATLLVGLVGGLLGGAAVMAGWTATTRRRRPRPAAGT